MKLWAVSELIREQPLRTGGEHVRFTLLGMVALHDAHAAQWLRQPPSHFRVDLWALTKDGANGLEGTLQDQAEDHQDDKRQQRHLHGKRDQITEGKDGREHASDEVDHTCAYDVPNTFYIGHDACDKGAGAVGIVERYWQPADMGLNLRAQFRNEALPCLWEQLGERERSDTLQDRRRHHRPDDQRQQPNLPLIHHVIDEISRARRQDKPTCTIHNH